jgi:hypothetical protein
MISATPMPIAVNSTMGVVEPQPMSKNRHSNVLLHALDDPDYAPVASMSSFRDCVRKVVPGQ